ncbi:DUF4178 domain-containing protein [Spirochaetota bacterium]
MGDNEQKDKEEGTQDQGSQEQTTPDQSKDPKLKAMKCHSCGADIVKSYRVIDEDETAPIGKCLGCGTEYDQHSQEYYEYFADDFTRDKDSSIFELGLKGTYKDIEYEIIGRIRLQEEDEYEQSTWDEWLGISSEGVYHYFVEEDGEVHSYSDYVPESIDMESDDYNIIFEGKKISKSDAYMGRIVYAEGELPWQPEIGEPVTCYDFKKDGYKFSIEQSENEISITRGERISYKDIINAFGKEEVKVLYNNTVKKRKSYKSKSLIYLVAAILSFSLSVFNCGSGTKLKGIMNNRNIITSNEYKVEKNRGYYFSQVLYGPFAIPRGGSLYDVKLFINERIHRLYLEWQEFRMMVIKEDRLLKATNEMFDSFTLKKVFNEIDALENPVESYTITGDFWDEAGVDSEGYRWHENDLEASSNFVIDEAGKYYAYIELYNNKIRRVESVRVSMEKVKSFRYYVIIMFVFFVLFIANRARSKSYSELPFELAKD